jgi:hypothetical protein
LTAGGIGSHGHAPLDTLQRTIAILSTKPIPDLLKTLEERFRFAAPRATISLLHPIRASMGINQDASVVANRRANIRMRRLMKSFTGEV